MLGRGPGRRRETVIEETPPAAGHRRHDPVEHLPAPLVRVEPLVEERPQGPAALRPPLADHPFGQPRAGRPPERVHGRPIVLQERHEIPHGREPGALDRRPPRLIGQLVDGPGLEAALEGHVELDQPAALVQAVVAGPQTPPVAGHRFPRVPLAQPAGQGRFRQTHDQRFEGELIPVADGQAVGGGVRRELGPDRAEDRYRIGRIVGHRRFEPQQVRGHRHLGDPAARHRDVSALEKEGLAAPGPPAAVVHDV